MNPRDRSRPRIAFFDAADVFEDFYPHYGVDQRAFTTTWASSSGNHAFVHLLQREVGDVTWYQVSLDPTLDRARHQVLGCEVRFLRSPLLHRMLWKAFYLPKNAWRWRSAYRPFATVASYAALASPWLVAAIGRDRPDVFLVQDYASGRFDMLMAIARLLRVPLMARHSGSTPDRYLGGRVRRWTLPKADLIIPSGQGEMEMLVTRFGVPRDRMVVVLTPIDVSTFRPLDRTAACAAFDLDPSRRYVVFVGRFDPVKRLDAIVREFAALAGKHADADLLLAGSGREQESLSRIVAGLPPGRVRIIGWVSEPERKAQLFSLAECLVLASEREGLPAVVGEAMACGTPVLSSRVGGVPELVTEGETGWMFAPRDDDGLREKLDWVLEHAEAVRGLRPHVRRIASDRVSPTVAAAALRACFFAAGVRNVSRSLTEAGGAAADKEA
jgi:glycosyltransferase involved in cell wall biosynthesis